MAKTFNELIAGANKIRTNELPETNTHTLVGEQILEMVNKQVETDKKVDDNKKTGDENLKVVKEELADGIAGLEQSSNNKFGNLNSLKTINKSNIVDAVNNIIEDEERILNLDYTVNAITGVAVNQSSGFFDVSSLKIGDTVTLRYDDTQNITTYGFIYVKTVGGGWVAPTVLSSNTDTKYTLTDLLEGIYIGFNSSAINGDGQLDMSLKFYRLEKSIISDKANSEFAKYPIVAKGNNIIAFNDEIGFANYDYLKNNIQSIVIGGDNTKNRYVRNIWNYVNYLPNTYKIDDPFLIQKGLQNVDCITTNKAVGENLRIEKWLHATDGDIFDKLTNAAGKIVRIEVYVYSAHKDFPTVSTSNKIYANGYKINAPLTAVEDTSSEFVKKLIFSSAIKETGTFEYILFDFGGTATSNYTAGEYGYTGWKIGVFENRDEEATKLLIGDWDYEKLNKLPITSDYVNNPFFYNKVNSYGRCGERGTYFNQVGDIRRAASLFIRRYNKKYVDEYNRLLVSLNGDSIIGSQLDDIAHSEGYNTGDFPPNLSKMIMARQFFDRYRFSDEDVKFRNLIHPDWSKTGFNVPNGKDDPTKTFNEIESYGCNGASDNAQITVTGHKYLKIVWSEYTGKPYSFKIDRSSNGGTSWQTIETIEVTSARQMMVAYKIYVIDPAISYIYKVTPVSNYADICFWGVEMWNNPRLDVVVEAVSGSTAKSNLAQFDRFYSEFHKPALIIMDIYSINDWAHNKNTSNWLADLFGIYNKLRDLGIPVISFGTHYATSHFVEMGCEALETIGYTSINMLSKIRDTGFAPTKNICNTTDGLHLSDYGNAYFFEELKRIFG